MPRTYKEIDRMNRLSDKAYEHETAKRYHLEKKAAAADKKSRGIPTPEELDAQIERDLITAKEPVTGEEIEFIKTLIPSTHPDNTNKIFLDEGEAGEHQNKLIQNCRVKGLVFVVRVFYKGYELKLSKKGEELRKS